MAKNSLGSSPTKDEASPYEALFDRASSQEVKELVGEDSLMAKSPSNGCYCKTIIYTTFTSAQ
eukprot:4295180-Ditylum_brightwellii.AAC.1